MTQAALALNDYQQHANVVFAHAVKTAPRQLVFDYRQQHGRVVSPSLAAQLAPNYPIGIHEIAALGTAFERPAHDLAAHIWQAVVNDAADTDANEELTALVIAGPKGSGKTNMMRTLKREITERAQGILFTSLSDALWVFKRIEEALAASERMQVVVAYIHRPVELCARITLQRAIETGHTTSLDLLATQIYEAQSAVPWLTDRFRKNSRVHISVIDA